MTDIRGERTALRCATDDDVELLVAWHADPDVARYWDDETFTPDEMRGRLARDDVEPYVVEEHGVAVGYLQIHDLDRDGDGGLDMFLVPEARGRGLGPEIARAAARHLLDGRGWVRVTVDPYRWNDRAVRAWERAGFVAVSDHDADDEHTAPWILMEFRGE